MAEEHVHVDLDFNQNKVKQMVLESLTSAPAGGIRGQMYFDTTLTLIGFHDGSIWHYWRAQDIPYDNTDSGLTATDVKQALDELTIEATNAFSSHQILDLYQTATNQQATSTTFVDVIWDASRFAGSDYSWSNPNSDIEINTDGVYELSYHITCETNSGTRAEFSCRAQLSGTTIDGSICHGYQRNPSTGTNTAGCAGLIFSATAGQVIKIQFNKESGGVISTTYDNACHISLKRLYST